MSQIHNGGGRGSEEVLFTNCNFRFLFVWSSRASLFMTDVELCSWTFIYTYDLFFPKFPFNYLKRINLIYLISFSFFLSEKLGIQCLKCMPTPFSDIS